MSSFNFDLIKKYYWQKPKYARLKKSNMGTVAWLNLKIIYYVLKKSRSFKFGWNHPSTYLGGYIIFSFNTFFAQKWLKYWNLKKC